MKFIIGIISFGIVVSSCGTIKWKLVKKYNIIALDTLLTENANYPGTYLTSLDTVVVEVSILIKNGDFKSKYKVINR